MEWQPITMWDCNSLSVFEHVKVFNHCQSGTFCRKRRCSYQEGEVGNYKVTGENSTLGRSVHNIVQKKKTIFVLHTSSSSHCRSAQSYGGQHHSQHSVCRLQTRRSGRMPEWHLPLFIRTRGEGTKQCKLFIRLYNPEEQGMNESDSQS